MERKKTSAAIIFILMVFLAHSAWGASAVPVSPGNAAGTAVTDQVCPAFSWSAAEGAVSYWIEVYEQTAAGVLPYDQMSALANPVRVGDIPAPALSWTPPLGECLDRGVKYVWYVIGVDRENYGDWSEGRAFQVDASALSVEQKEAVQEAVRTYLKEEAVSAVRTAETNTTGQVTMVMSSDDGISGTDAQTKSESEGISAQAVLPSSAVQIDGALNVAGSIGANGGIRLGSETGTAEAPLYPTGGYGLVIRRARTTAPTNGNIVAMTDNHQLQRDGTNAGFKIVTTGSGAISCMGTTSTGASANFNSTLASGTTTQVYTNAQNIVFFTCSFGHPDQHSTHETQVTLHRQAADWWWTGTITSSYNQ
jgi:hypothetical protein